MSVFEVLAKNNAEGEQAKSRAVLASRARAEETFSAFLSGATSEVEYETRLSAVADDLAKISREVVAEYGYNDVNDIYNQTYHYLAGRYAAEIETGDNYQQDRESLSTADNTGLGDTGAVETDKSQVPADGLKPIDVKSVRHNLEEQRATDRAEYDDKDFDPQNKVTDRIDAQKPIAPEFYSAPNTKTWSGENGQADPVTSALHKYEIVSTG